MVLDTLPRISIIAIGVERYENMRPLFGPSSDIKNIRSMLTVMPDTALFNDSQFIEVLNPSSAELRQQITNYVLGRSARGDILIFYFSGHGIALGSMDFGFCTVDTNIHPGAGSVLPFTLVKFSEIMASLSIISSSRKGLNMVYLAQSKETQSHVQAHNQDYPNNSF